MSKNAKLGNLIKAVQKHPIIYQPAPSDVTFIEHKNNLKAAWEAVRLQLGPQHKNFREQWIRLFHTYAKIMMLIDSGTISKKVFLACKETSYFLDGSLSFLNPYLTEEIYSKIPFHIHRSINTIFGLPLEHGQNKGIEYNINIATHDQVLCLLRNRTECSESFDMSLLLPIVQKAIQRKLKELFREKEKNEEANRSAQTDLELESELIIDENIKIENQDDNDTIEENYSLGSHTMIEEDNDIEQILPDGQIVFSDSEMSGDIPEHSAGSMTNKFIGTISDEYIKKMFNDLGETMSAELTIQKQKLLQLRINELLRNTLIQE